MVSFALTSFAKICSCRPPRAAINFHHRIMKMIRERTLFVRLIRIWGAADGDFIKMQSIPHTGI